MTDKPEVTGADALKTGEPVLSLSNYANAIDELSPDEDGNLHSWLQYRQAVALEGILRLLKRIESIGGFRRG